MPRLFVALDVPERIKDDLTSLEKPDLQGAHWTTRPTWHITLHFIGDAEIDPIDSALAAVDAAPFALQLAGVGTFPKKRNPRVLWVGLDAPPALYTLHKRIGAALRSTGFVPEDRPYHPHLTLARFKGRPPARHIVEPYLARYADLSSEPFTVTHFTLYESELTPQGAAYTARGRYPLRGIDEDDT